MNIPISLRIFKCPGASPNVTVEYPENCEYPENIWDIKFESLNILKDIEVGYTENPEYPEKYSVKYSVLSPNINILVNIQKTSSSDGVVPCFALVHQGPRSQVPTRSLSGL